MRAWMPWCAWAHRVSRQSLKLDALAGLTGALIVLPQGIAYAAIAGLPPEYGLYSAIGPVIVAALFGSSWHLVSGPTAAISIVVFSALAPLAPPGGGNYIQLALTLGFLVGLIQLATGLANLGRLAHYISHSVVVGFTSGAAFLIVASQLKNILGLHGISATGFFSQIGQVLNLIPQTQWPILAVGLMALFASLAAQRIHRNLPYMIVGMVSAAFLAMSLGNVPTVGALPAALPRLSVPSFDLSLWTRLLASAAIIGVLGLTEAIAIARSVALRSGQYIDSNQEVIGQGLSNLAGSFLSAYPSSGSFTRSGLNFDAGAKTPLAAAFSSICLIGLLALITGWISYLPMAAMAGILFLVAWGLIDRRAIAEILKGPHHERWILAVTFLSTLVVQLEYAVFIGIALSLLFRRLGLVAEDDGGQRTTSIPVYVSGLPVPTLTERLELAKDFCSRGFSAFKYAAAVSFEGIVNEMRVLREGLGPDVKLMVDLHWKFTAQEAIQLIDQLMPYRPYFVEAPCHSEDIEGQAHVGANIRVPLALGEEWHTVYEALPRIERRSMSILQPEIAHTGISQFMQICHMANAFHMKVIPHASIGIGIFQAASLHATAALPNCPMHEYQHSIFDKNLRYVKTTMRCESGAFVFPEGPGLGIEPHEDVWQFVRSKEVV